MNLIIRKETPDDCREVENLIRESFWNVYRPAVWMASPASTPPKRLFCGRSRLRSL